MAVSLDLPTPPDHVKIKRALISVSDKTGIVEFGKFLADAGVEVLSTGGTRKALVDAGVPAIEVADVTGFPEILDGRVKTLHPKVHGGLLAVRGLESHKAALAEHGLPEIDLLVVNLYPFEETVAGGADAATCVENIDIGGPTMVRSAAKNNKHVAIVVNSSDYSDVINQLTRTGGLSQTTRTDLACKAFEHTALYDGAIANYLGAQLDTSTKFPRSFNTQLKKVQYLSYGQSPPKSTAFSM